MGNINGMRAILGLLLVSPVVPMCTVPRPLALRCPPSSASSPSIMMRFGGGDVQTNQTILRKEQRNALIINRIATSLKIPAVIYTGAMVAAGPEAVSPIQLGALVAAAAALGAVGGLADARVGEIESLYCRWTSVGKKLRPWM